METKAYNVSMLKTFTKKNLNSINIHRKSEHLCEFRVIACLVNCKTRLIKNDVLGKRVYQVSMNHYIHLSETKDLKYDIQSPRMLCSVCHIYKATDSITYGQRIKT